jgi:hypothetical protein
MSTYQLIPSKSLAVTSPSFTPVRSGLLQRKCACGGTPGPTGECEACRKKKLQRRPDTPAPSTINHQLSTVSEVPPIVHEVLRSPGQPLDLATRAFMEPRFGHDFSKVRISSTPYPAPNAVTINPPGDPFEQEADRIAARVMQSPASEPSASHKSYDFSRVRMHTDAQAADSARSVNALAYTVGEDVVFGAGQYAPSTAEGRRLMAHELTHIVQQSGQLQRAVSPTSTCPANAHGAPASPLAALGAANARAVLMALGASHLLFSESLFMRAGEPPSSTFNAYVHRFGTPSAVGPKFRNRFTSHLENTLLLAQAKEMEFLATRMAGVSKFLGRNIRFKCTGTSHTTIGACAHHCKPSDDLASCASGHHHEMAICQGFWGLGTPNQQAIGMIHEVGHMVHHLGDHDVPPFANTSAKRILEPECYASMVADIYGITPFDPSCP